MSFLACRSRLPFIASFFRLYFHHLLFAFELLLGDYFVILFSFHFLEFRRAFSLISIIYCRRVSKWCLHKLLAFPKALGLRWYARLHVSLSSSPYGLINSPACFWRPTMKRARAGMLRDIEHILSHFRRPLAFHCRWRSRHYEAIQNMHTAPFVILIRFSVRWMIFLDMPLIWFHYLYGYMPHWWIYIEFTTHTDYINTCDDALTAESVTAWVTQVCRDDMFNLSFIEAVSRLSLSRFRIYIIAFLYADTAALRYMLLLGRHAYYSHCC